MENQFSNSGSILNNYTIEGSTQGFLNSDIARKLREIATRVSAAETKSYMSERFVGHPTLGFANLKHTPVSKEVKNLLDPLSAKECVVLLTFVSDKATKTVVTTFNISEVLTQKGFGVNYTKQKPVEIGKSMVIGADKSEFPKDAEGYVTFTDVNKQVFVLPIVSRMINTNYFTMPGVERPLFIPQICDTAKLVATFTCMTNGVVKAIQASEAGNLLLDFPGVLPDGMNDKMIYVVNTLQEWITALPSPNVKGWSAVSLNGLMFAHYVYLALNLQAKRNSTWLGELSYLTSMLVKPIVVGNIEYNYLHIDGEQVATVAPAVRLPRTLANVAFEFKEKHCTMDQAMTALSLARGFRGENKGDRGSLNRGIYLPVNLSPAIAEICYFATDYARYILSNDDLLVMSDAGLQIGVIMMLLQALVILEFRGNILLPNLQAVKNMIQRNPGYNVADQSYSFPGGDYTIYLGETNLYLSQGEYIKARKEKHFWIPKDDSVIIDLRPITGSTSFVRGNYIQFEQNVSNTYLERISELNMYKKRAVFRCSAIRHMYAEGGDELQVLSGCQVHNLVAFVSLGYAKFDCKDVYNLKSSEEFEEYACASVVANVAKCMHAVYRTSPRILLFKLNFRVPNIKILAVGKLSVASVVFADAGFQEAMQRGPLAVVNYFAASDPAGKAAMLQIPAVREAIEGSTTVQNVPTVAPVIEKSSVALFGGDEDKEPDSYD